MPTSGAPDVHRQDEMISAPWRRYDGHKRVEQWHKFDPWTSAGNINTPDKYKNVYISSYSLIRHVTHIGFL
ncbi:hypothetical protein GTPT_1143 [Tatumella ptyseos ATCC 33301]|uniref:Uncharacterized protein n=1 Tax=Tatumella ptyseos ATCC 33301 TaxID=1005995 RepID=A0A085JJG4_9GAMM|nr:hypothetical protein GTPT_1143 [Tatumella ptyseos ATCC 33301]